MPLGPSCELMGYRQWKGWPKCMGLPSPKDDNHLELIDMKTIQTLWKLETVCSTKLPLSLCSRSSPDSSLLESRPYHRRAMNAFRSAVGVASMLTWPRWEISITTLSSSAGNGCFQGTPSSLMYIQSAASLLNSKRIPCAYTESRKGVMINFIHKAGLLN